MKKTLVLGASPNPLRYSYMAVERLTGHGHPVIAVGSRDGEIGKIKIEKNIPADDFHTVTLYLNPERQKQYYEKILGLKPKRIIFNPGTENTEFENMAEARGIEVVEGCTLVMLGSQEY